MNKAERPFELITLSDVDCIRGLIKFRSLLDPYYKLEQDNYYDHAGDVKPLNVELIAVYVDLMNCIKKIKLNIKEKFVLEKMMDGYKAEEIAEMFNRDVSNIHKTLNAVCRKIKDVNDRAWKYDCMYTSYLKVPWQYKKCEKCREFKPLHTDFYSKNPWSQDGFYDSCNECWY